MKRNLSVKVTLSSIIGGGQAIGTLEDGKKVMAWGGLPGETVEVQVTKKKSKYLEGVVSNVITPSAERLDPKDPDSYLSTSPWQMMTFEAEQHYKSALIEEAFELHDIVLPQPIDIYSDGNQYGYRNKIEYSFWFDTDTKKLSLAFFRRGTHGKISVDETSLASPAITAASKAIIDVLNELKIGGRDLKTLMIRSNVTGDIAWQLYVKDESVDAKTIMDTIESRLPSLRAEVIYSNPKSPASVITKRLVTSSEHNLTDTIHGVSFSYATEGFFQINLPVYEQTIKDMEQWVEPNKSAVDLYSGVGTIGLTIGGDNVTLIELNEHAVREMKRNITELGREKNAKAILAASEDALDHITSDATIIVDPPRAGLHENVIDQLLDVQPDRIVYLSCNPVTQARDVARLASIYGIRYHQGYNFFPRTPHIEHLVILDKKQS